MINYNGTVINENQPEEDKIELSLPINPAYVSAARLTASSIANRIGFDIDEIEDVKAAVSEACTFIIKNAPKKDREMFRIAFVIVEKTLTISLEVKQMFSKVDIQDEMGLLMIKALMQSMEITKSGEPIFCVTLTKMHQLNDFN